MIKLRHVDRFLDRHGRARFYFRRGKGPRRALPGLPGSPEFMEAYQAAIGSPSAPSKPPVPRSAPGTFNCLALGYFASTEFLRLRTHTQHVYRLVIERFLLEHGHRPVAGMKRSDVKRLIAQKSGTPGAANDLLKKLRALMKFALDEEWRADDPTLRVKTFPEGEFHSWTDEEIAQFEAHWSVGTRARLAFALLLYTGQRKSDVARMAWGDVAGTSIRVVQGKTGAKLTIPLHTHLQGILIATKREHVAILTTMFGRPFSSAGFGNWLADIIGQAGLPDRCVTHGLRTAAARRLAEAGCTEKQIAAVTGHKTLREIARYTKAADQELLAEQAIAKLPEQNADIISQTHSPGLGNQ